MIFTTRIAGRAYRKKRLKEAITAFSTDDRDSAGARVIVKCALHARGAPSDSLSNRELFLWALANQNETISLGIARIARINGTGEMATPIHINFRCDDIFRLINCFAIAAHFKGYSSRKDYSNVSNSKR